MGIKLGNHCEQWQRHINIYIPLVLLCVTFLFSLSIDKLHRTIYTKLLSL